MQTYPAGGSGYSGITVNAGTQTQIYTFGNRATQAVGTLRVFKYEDRNGNGTQDSGEPGIAGWTFSYTGTTTGTMTTGANGSGSKVVTAGTYTLTEQQQNGWTQTQPGGGAGYTNISVSAGAESALSIFGNYQPPVIHYGRLRVTKYHDVNANGLRDSGEASLAGWTFEVRSGTALVQTITTGSDGTASAWLLPGSFTVAEVVQASWRSVDPGGSAPTKAVNIIADQTTDVIFGNTTLTTIGTQIVIFKYVDDNVNARRDAGEPGTGGFTFLVRTASGTPVAAVTTQSTGYAFVADLPYGTYTVVEQPLLGWFNTDPGGTATRSVHLNAANSVAQVMFGNAPIRLPSTSTAGDVDTLLAILFIAGTGLIVPGAARIKILR
jgi:hypothetical protein